MSPFSACRARGGVDDALGLGPGASPVPMQCGVLPCCRRVAYGEPKRCSSPSEEAKVERLGAKETFVAWRAAPTLPEMHARRAQQEPQKRSLALAWSGAVLVLAQRSAVRRRATGTVSDLSKQMRQQRKDLEASMEKDEDLKLMMQGLRGSGLNDSDRQIEGLEMRLVDVPTDQDSGLPLSYDPEILRDYFDRLPGLQLQRSCLQEAFESCLKLFGEIG